MTEVEKKYKVIFTVKNVLIITALLLGCCLNSFEAKQRKTVKKTRNGFARNHYPAKYQRRSSFCLQLHPNGRLDDTATLRFHRETQRCYRVGERGPCGELMVFTIEDATFGTCDCDQSLRCGRPLIFWPSTNRCYYAYDQGPCREGKWLVFGFDLHPVCRRNPCIEQELRRPSYENHYWFSYKGQCFRTYSQGYCEKNEILFNMKTHFRPTCVRNPECSLGLGGGGRKPLGIIQSLSCLPGQRLDFYGRCKRAYQPLVPLKNTTGLGIPVTQRPSNLHCLFCKYKNLY